MANSPERLTVMQVATRLSKRYQKARDLMLSGQLGDAKYDEHRKLTVPLLGVIAYEQRRALKTAQERARER